jgi:hypothetical protein
MRFNKIQISTLVALHAFYIPKTRYVVKKHYSYLSINYKKSSTTILETSGKGPVKLNGLFKHPFRILFLYIISSPLSALEVFPKAA